MVNTIINPRTSNCCRQETCFPSRTRPCTWWSSWTNPRSLLRRWRTVRTNIRKWTHDGNPEIPVVARAAHCTPLTSPYVQLNNPSHFKAGSYLLGPTRGVATNESIDHTVFRLVPDLIGSGSVTSLSILRQHDCVHVQSRCWKKTDLKIEPAKRPLKSLKKSYLRIHAVHSICFKIKSLFFQYKTLETDNKLWLDACSDRQ